MVQFGELLRQEPLKQVMERSCLEQLGRFLLRNDWAGGISAGVAWVVFVQFTDSRTVDVAGRHLAHTSEPLGPCVAGRCPVFTQMVQPASLQGRCTLPGGLRSQLPAG